MKTDNIFPYLVDLRTELLDMIEELTQEQWTARFGRRTIYSAESVVFRLTEQERWWIGHVCQSLAWDEIRPTGRKNKNEALELLNATFALTDRFIDTLEPESLRLVRTVPPDVQTNRPEENRRIDWILWQVVTEEVTALSQIRLLTQL